MDVALRILRKSDPSRLDLDLSNFNRLVFNEKILYSERLSKTVFDINKETFTVNTAQMFENAMMA